MSYEKDQFGGGPGGGEGSTSVATMISTALVPYASSNSVSVMITSRLTPYLTSASAALSTYLTSSSFATAIAPYLTSASANLGSYLTSSSFATAIAPYLTSASAVTALATKQPNFSVADEGTTLSTIAGTVTTINFVGTGISASLTGGLLTVTAVAGAGSGEGSVSVSSMISTALGGGFTSTASFAAVTVASRPVGAVLLGYQTLSNVNSWGFSGSWSDFCILEARSLFRVESGTSATTSAAIYSDGGTTPFLNLATASATASTNQIIALDLSVYGGDGRPIKALRANTAKGTNLTTTAVTATANTAFVNCIRFFTSATITAGMAVLHGWRKV